jgi:hypothetical protein
VRRAVALVTVVAASALALSACTGSGGPGGPGASLGQTTGRPDPPGQAGPASGRDRALPDPLYGVTIDDISNLSQIVTSLRHLPKRPATRIYFDVHQPPVITLPPYAGFAR